VEARVVHASATN